MFNLHGQKAVNIICKWLLAAGLGRAPSLRTMVRWFLVCRPKAERLLAHHGYEAWQTKAQKPVLRDDVTFDLH